VSRQIRIVCVGVLAFAIGAATVCDAQRAGRDPEVVKEQFNAVAQRLDMGGDLFVVANVDGLIEEWVGNLVEMVTLIPETDSEAAKVQAVLEKLPAFLEKNGFYAVKGFGMSVVPRADGLHNVKTFLSRDAAAAGLPLWRGLVGLQQRRLAGLDFLPADTVFADAGAGDLKQIWKLVREGVAELAPAEAAAAFDQGLAAASLQLGTSLDDLIGTLGDEGFLSVQFSQSASVDLPMPTGEMMSMPSPSLLVGIAVADDTLVNVIDAQLTQKGMPVIKSDSNGTVLRTVPLPLPVPVPLQPTYTTHEGMFLFGSSTDVVSAALSASREKNGLVYGEEFRKAFEGVSMTNNGISYVSPRFAEVLADVQAKAMATAEQQNPEAGKFFASFMKKQGPQSSAMATFNWKSGILTTGTSSSGGREILASLAVAPVGLMAAIAIPSFVKARQTSQQNACINNLRIIDAAKEQWALANRKSEGDEVDLAGICEYIKGGTLPVCPQGGVYTVNPIGEDPTCSIPGHSLP